MDLSYKWLTQFVTCLHWFNAIVHLIRREINQACELSCDEAVISKPGGQERRAYGDTLLNAVKTAGGYKNSVASVTLCESRKQLDERLGAIIAYKKQTKIITGISLALLFLLLSGSACIGAYPAHKSTDSAQAPPDIPVKTARAAHVIQKEQPDVDVIIDEYAAVKLVSTAALCFNSVFRETEKIDAFMEQSSIFYTVPSGFLGELDAEVPDSYLELRSEDGYRNCSVTLSNCSSVDISADAFTKSGDQLTYSDGTDAGLIDINFRDSGYAVVMP